LNTWRSVDLKSPNGTIGGVDHVINADGSAAFEESKQSDAVVDQQIGSAFGAMKTPVRDPRTRKFGLLVVIAGASYYCFHSGQDNRLSIPLQDSDCDWRSLYIVLGEPARESMRPDAPNSTVELR
jgi:hypothetical protein